MSAATKKPRETLTLRDTTDLLIDLNRWIEDHVDELELNGGALPDDLAKLHDEINGSRADRADAIAYKVDEFTGFATTAKAVKDRSARRQKVWENAVAAIKAYALREVERAGGDRIRGAVAVLRIQGNSAPATEVRFDNEQLLAFADSSVSVPPIEGGVMRYEPHPLAKYITVERIAHVDRKAIGAAYEARGEELHLEASLELSLIEDGGEREVAAEAWARRVNEILAAEFPGVTVTRGHHLRID